jgi:beta-glucosidase
LHELIKQRLPESANVVTLPKVLNWQKISAHLTDLYTQARKSDVVLLCVGNNRDVESESFDRSTLRLLPHQEAMILNTARQNENVVVLLFAGSAVDMSPWIDKVKAVLLVGFAGEGVYEAAADVVCGNACPCGKLSETFPIALEDCPAGHYEGDGFVERYNEGVFVGYRWFDEKQKDVLFPFGHGLSYAKFEYSDLQIKKTGETDFEVSYLITNNSGVDAKEISQVYVGDPISMVPRPKKELKGFTKTFIPAHESRRVTVKLDFRSFAYYSVMLKRWHVEDGEFIISVGASSRDIRLQESVWIEQDETTQVSPN